MNDIVRRARTWIAQGQGLAAITAWCRFMALSGAQADPPSSARDVADVMGLLHAVPEWRGRLAELGELSSEWKTLVDNWDMVVSDPAKIHQLLPDTNPDGGDMLRFVFVGRVGGPHPNWPEARENLSNLGFEKRLDAWVSGSDTGMSSRTLWASMLGLDGVPVAHPRDPLDLGRCLRLLEVFPEWRERLPELSSLSPEWHRLTSAWGRLEAAMRQEVGIAWEKASAAPRTSELMMAVLQPKKGWF